jgi:HEAT repeat protein
MESYVSEVVANPHQFLPSLRDALTHEDWRMRSSAAHVLGQVGTRAEGACSGLLRLARDPVVSVRTTTAHALARVCPTDAKTVGALVDLIGDDSEIVREAAIRALLWVPDLDPSIVAALMVALGDDASRVSVNAARMLAYHNVIESSVVDVLVSSLRSGERHVAVLGLLSMNEVPEVALPDLVGLLGEDAATAVSAAQVLRKMGGRAVSAVPDLLLLRERLPAARKDVITHVIEYITDD